MMTSLTNHLNSILWGEAFALALLLVWLWRTQQRLRALVIWNSEYDTPLREVVTVQVEIEREFLLEALKLPAEEIATTEVGAIKLRLEIWKDHYSGEIAFFGKSTGISLPLLECDEVHVYPTDMFQFPIRLGSYPLFGRTEQHDRYPNFGPNSQEKLEVLLFHRAIVIRAVDGRFPWARARYSYQPIASDLVIPLRSDDLAEYRDRYGEDDARWLMMVGNEQRYRQHGRWMCWSVCTTPPQMLSRFKQTPFDTQPVKANDGGATLAEPIAQIQSPGGVESQR
jgi:hypothetical protein